MNELLGKLIHKLYISKDRKTLIFITDQGQIGYDICGTHDSPFFLATITGAVFLWNATVRQIDELGGSEFTYGYRIHTNKGPATIVFTGYGDLELHEESLFDYELVARDYPY